MKILSLNLWGGKEFDALMTFLERMKKDVDVFVFQEMLYGTEPKFSPENEGRENLCEEISARLNGFVRYEYHAAPGSRFAGEEVPFDVGQAIYVKEGVAPSEAGGFRTYLEGGLIWGDASITITGNCQWVRIDAESGPITIANLHGLWQGGSDKRDTPERIEQSRIVQEFLTTQPGRKILLGDFNMRPDIESMELIGEGMRDLIQEYEVISTRSSLYTKDVPFSDYAFITPDVQLTDFKVLPDEVSDHLPLLLEIEA